MMAFGRLGMVQGRPPLTMRCKRMAFWHLGALLGRFPLTMRCKMMALWHLGALLGQPPSWDAKGFRDTLGTL